MINMDYATMGDKDVEEEEAEVADADSEYNRSNSDDSKVNILVARDSKSRICAAITVPKKGADQKDCNIK